MNEGHYEVVIQIRTTVMGEEYESSILWRCMGNHVFVWRPSAVGEGLSRGPQYVIEDTKIKCTL